MGPRPQLFVLDGVPAPGKTPEQVEAALREQVAQWPARGRDRGRTQPREDPLGGGRGVQAGLGDEPGPRGWAASGRWALPLDAGERLIQRLRAVTAQQVQSVTAKYFGDDQLTVAVLRLQPVDKTASPRTPPPGFRH